MRRQLGFAGLIVGAALGGCSANGSNAGIGGGQGGAGGAVIDGGGDDSSIVPDSSTGCYPGTWACSGKTRYMCAADGKSREQEQVCESACDPVAGCVDCIPGRRMCEGTVSMVCESGGKWVTGRDCKDWNVACGASGFCVDACADAESTKSYVGCEYWPVPLANSGELNSTLFDFRVVVGNPDSSQANVEVTRGGVVVYSGKVPAGGLSEIKLPWVDGMSFGIASGSWKSITTANGAYRLRSDRPVTVAQFNPFEYNSTATDGTATFSYTNDATLLLPSHVLTGDYAGLSYLPLSKTSGTTGMPFPTPPSSIAYGGYLAIVGVTLEPTDVEVQVSGNSAAEVSGKYQAASKSGTIKFTLARGEVAHVMAAVPPKCEKGRPGYLHEEDCTFKICDYTDYCGEKDYDLTGSRIRANHPVEVFGGHVCAYVPYTTQACDHLETQLSPIQTWGKAYVSRPMTDDGGAGANLVRVVAAFNGTQVTVDPPQGGVGNVTLNQNEWTEFMATKPFSVSATEAVMVGQFLVGQQYSKPEAKRGDPAMTVLVPSEQYRKDYSFVLPSSYNDATNGQNYVLISRLPGKSLTVDGAAVTTTFEAIGGREVGILKLAGGTHSMSCSEPFGLIAYGLGTYTSYVYPAGLNLDEITVIK